MKNISNFVHKNSLSIDSKFINLQKAVSFNLGKIPFSKITLFKISQHILKTINIFSNEKKQNKKIKFEW